MGVIRRRARWAAGLALAVLAVTVAAVLYFSDRNLELYGEGRGLAGRVDAIIVLGAGVDPDGVLGFSSRRRVRVGVGLLRDGSARRLILAGGSRSTRYTPMAELMREYAVGLGAPPEALLIEAGSVSTFENLRFSFAMAECRGLERLAVLTDAYHLQRARLLAGYFGHPDIALVAAPGLGREDIVARSWGILREALAWWYNLGKVAAWEALGALGLDAEARREWIK